VSETGNEITLDFDKLRQHANLVTSVADEVNGAISSVKSGHLGTEMFGIMCAFLVPPSLAMSVAATGMLGSNASLMLRTSAGLSQTANQWEQLEHNVSTTYQGISKAMG
jgi:hypothetical protein